MTFSQEKLIQTFHFESHFIGFRLKKTELLELGTKS